MLSIFKSNNPAVIVFYFFYLLLFRVCLVWLTVDNSFVFSHTEPLSALLFSSLKNVGGNQQFVSAVLGAVLCFFQALLVNGIVNNNKMLARKSYVAGATFIVFASFLPNTLLLTPVSVALTFILLATGRIFSLVKNEKAHGDIFDVGFFIGIAALFYFPSLMFILFAYIGLAIVRPFNYREWVIVLTGLAAPFMVVFVYYYWNDNTPSLLSDLLNRQGNGWLLLSEFSDADKLRLGALALCTLAGLLLLPGSLHASLIQVRKFANILVVLTLFVFLAVLLRQTVRLSHWVMLAFPLGIFTGMVLLKIKRNWVAEVIYLILILLVLVGQYLSVFNSI